MATIRQSMFVGDRPEPEIYQFLDSDGLPVDLTGYTPSLKWKGTDGVQHSSTASVVSAVAGTVTWYWPSAIFDPPSAPWVVGANVVVTGGSLTYRSDDFILRIVRAAGGQ